SGLGQVVVRDPDGIFVELQQVRTSGFPRGAGPEDPKVRLGITVEDPVKTTQFYSQALGFYGRSGTRSASLQVPGDGFPVSFAATDYVDRKAVHSDIHDPGSALLRLRVSDFDAVLKAVKAAGAVVVSAGGEPVNLGRNRAVILRDINNLFLQLLESASSP